MKKQAPSRKKSAAIKFLSHNAGNKTLRITFPSGSEYKYRRVPQAVAHSLRDSASPGVFYNAAIKGKYECVQMK